MERVHDYIFESNHLVRARFQFMFVQVSLYLLPLNALFLPEVPTEWIEKLFISFRFGMYVLRSDDQYIDYDTSA